MNRSTQFKNLLITISEVYDIEFSVTKAKAWWSVLREYPVSAMEEAFKQHMACVDQGSYAPKPANLIQHMTGSTKSDKRNAKFKSQLAWAEIQRSFDLRISPFNNPDLDENAKDTLSIMNWRKSDNMDSFYKNEFKDIRSN